MTSAILDDSRQGLSGCENCTKARRYLPQNWDC